MIYLNKQQTVVLQVLRQAGDVGFNSWDFTYKLRPGVKQAPTRINELREKGFSIASRHLKNRSVDYILMREPIDEVLLDGQKPKNEKPKMVWVTDNKSGMARQVTEEELMRPKQEAMFV